jgi:hypothetical protein
VNSKELRDLVLEKLQDEEYQSHFSEVFLHKNEAGVITNIEIFQCSSSDGSIQNRNQIDWFVNEKIQYTKVSPLDFIELLKKDVSGEQNRVFFSTNGLML